jgi:uncharacterized protein
MIKKILSYLKRCVYQERSPQKLALSFCIGNYIAFSPYIGLHTAMVFFAVWFFSLNLGITFAAACGINNLWTLVPIYSADYIFGYWLVHKVMHLDGLLYTPQWLKYVNYFFEQNLGISSPCLWSFLIGGNILGILTSLILYPLMVKVFSKLSLEVYGEQ